MGGERTLNVYWNQRLVGHLIQDLGGQMLFTYHSSWLDDSQTSALSQSLPLRSESFGRNECRPFFAGILPEESQRERIAATLGISARNDFALLSAIGGECAGAVTFLESEPVAELPSAGYRPLEEQELAEVLRKIRQHPLMAGEEGVRLSLAGAQDKLAVLVEDGAVAIPLNGAASTHVLKPASPHFDGLIRNEHLCMDLARAVGLRVPHVQLAKAEDLSYLLIERFDRIRDVSETGSVRITRLHQEDFCQAIGVVPERKYQKEGGPSLKQCFELIRRVVPVPGHDLGRLLDVVLFNLIIGNNDSHGKNFSLLYSGVRGHSINVELAPFYDLLSTDFYPEVHRGMAMKLGGEYDSGRVGPRQLAMFAEEVGLGRAGTRTRLLELATVIREALTASTGDAYPELAEHIRARCELFLRGFQS